MMSPQSSKPAPIITLDPSAKITIRKENDRNIRQPVAGSLGMHVEGAACPHPDLTDTSTSVEGALFRVGPKIPGYGENRKTRRLFKRFVQKFLRKFLKPLKSDVDTSFEYWISRTTYSMKRKEELRTKYYAIGDKWDAKWALLKSFIKDEFYPDYKHARTINSRTDEFKTLVGPITQLIGDEVFALRYFIKKIPIDQRPGVIADTFRNVPGLVYATDFSSYEAHFITELMEDCEFELFRYMTQFLPEHEFFMHCARLTSGLNTMQFKTFSMKIRAKRASGEMWTSLGNSFSTLMITLFLIFQKLNQEKPHKTNWYHFDEACRTPFFGEGDDSLFKTSCNLTTQDYVDFGCRVKLETFTEYNRASFCGMVFDDVERTNVSDPREVLATFGWTSNKYIRSKKTLHMTLLRCKALSLAYQYPSCPILSSLAFNVLRLTRSYETVRFLEKHDRAFNQYELEAILEAQRRNKLGQLLFSAPGSRTRKLVEELYAISEDVQIKIEKYFDSMEEVSPLRGKLFLDLMPATWCDYYSKYSGCIRPKMAMFNSPGELWPHLKERVLGIEQCAHVKCA